MLAVCPALCTIIAMVIHGFTNLFILIAILILLKSKCQNLATFTTFCFCSLLCKKQIPKKDILRMQDMPQNNTQVETVNF